MVLGTVALGAPVLGAGSGAGAPVVATGTALLVRGAIDVDGTAVLVASATWLVTGAAVVVAGAA